MDTHESVVTCQVSFGPMGQAFGLAARLEVRIPDVPPEVVQELVEAAHEICPYSNATRGNIAVDVVAVDADR